jgi:hypothetical protein
VESLAGLRQRRAFECRLTADRALASLEEADAFLRGRGLLTRTPWYWTETLIDELVSEGRLRRVDGYVAAAGSSPPG